MSNRVPDLDVGDQAPEELASEGIPEVMYIEQSSDARVSIPGEDESLPDFSPSTPDPAEQFAQMSKTTDGAKRAPGARQAQSTCCLLL
jgi:hypothetical protein